MNFTISAKGSGKTIRVVDRIAHKTAYDSFLDLGASALVSVASNDGLKGNIDVFKALNGAANTVHETDYDVKADELLEVDD